MSDTPKPPVVVSRNPAVAKPWRWETKDISVVDPRFAGRYHFEDCEAAYDDAVANGHEVVEVRE